MSYGTYRQYDSRWGNKNYNGSSNYATAGCGPTSCANILHQLNPKITPLTTGNWMKSHGYAIRNQGTAWNGIPACLKHFGATDVRQVDKMADVYDLTSKGYVGVFLFRKGTKGGVTWTTSGHYIAVTGYKHANGKHYFKTFDSGGRKHDGWYCYETTMKGLIPRIWLCKVTKISKPTGKYAGDIPKPTLKKGSKGESVKSLQKFLEWYYPKCKFKNYGTFGVNTKAIVMKYQQAEGLTMDGVWGEKSYAKAKTYKKAETKKAEPKKSATPNADKLIAKMKELAWAYGTAKKKYAYKTGAPKAVCKKAMKKYKYDKKAEMSDCGNFVTTVVRESGVDKSFKALHGLKDPFPKTEKAFDIVHKGKAIPKGLLKPGDIIRYKKTNGHQHAMFYYGDGKISEASHYNRFGVILKDAKRYGKSNVKKSTIQVLRAKEKK